MHGDQVLLPAQFLPQVEREGLIDAMTESMLRKSCRWRTRWSASGLDLRLSVNVSMLNLARVDTADRYQQIVQQAGVRTRDVVLEVTEGSVMGEAASALNVLARLRLKGFGLAIDDFGTGYSSLVAALADSVHRTQDRPGLRHRSRASAAQARGRGDQSRARA